MKRKILIIEDDQFLRTILKEKLQKDGYHILEATNGLQGLRIALEENPHLILLDIIMPKADGISMLEELRHSKKCAQIPVVILTNYGKEESIKKSIHLDTVRFLLKDNSILKNLSQIVQEELG